MFGFSCTKCITLEERIECLETNFNYVSEELSRLEAHDNLRHDNRDYENMRTFIDGPEPKLPDYYPKILINILSCPITHEIMKDPWIDYEGNTYEKEAIIKYLDTSNESPITRSPLYADYRYIYPNRKLKDVIDNLRIN
tara:strand:- start:581 stop:997 length:417 start_codon:yes stop_codon:yes gene_type:complete